TWKSFVILSWPAGVATGEGAFWGGGSCAKAGGRRRRVRRKGRIDRDTRMLLVRSKLSGKGASYGSGPNVAPSILAFGGGDNCGIVLSKKRQPAATPDWNWLALLRDARPASGVWLTLQSAVS